LRSRQIAPHFTRDEARNFLHRRLRLRKPYAGDVPRKTIGVVVATTAWPSRPEEYDLVVTWKLPARKFCGRPRAFRDFMTRDDFLQFAELEHAAPATVPQQLKLTLKSA
jgi:hypothetical protein